MRRVGILLFFDFNKFTCLLFTYNMLRVPYENRPFNFKIRAALPGKGDIKLR